jgi:Response regulator containing a CheY-like receiver domain and an HD-GYP domain
LIKEKGQHFDPEIVELFLENKQEILEIKKKYAE